MVIVRLMGGLGNQMFQYALARSIADRHKTDFALDLEFLLDRTPRPNFVYRDYDLDIFRLRANFATRKDTGIFFPRNAGLTARILHRLRLAVAPYAYYREKHFHFDRGVFKLPSHVYLEGYWQSPTYFALIEDKIREDFTFAVPLSPEGALLAEEIKKVNSVCVNVRRTDFLTNNFHGVCDMRYFQPAMQIMAGRVDRPKFFVFSDDPTWCSENFKLDYDIVIVDHQYAGYKFAEYLQLMSMCRHYIIPNSTFAWWAAWFNHNKEKIVVAPTKWFSDPQMSTQDLIPKDWIRVKN